MLILFGLSIKILAQSYNTPINAVPNSLTNQQVSCEDLFEFIINKGYKKGAVSSYTMNSSWLNEVTAYSYENKIFVVAKIKENEYSYNTNSYIFCGIPSMNWTNFVYGGYGDDDSYGKRFHKYIMDYKCNCN